MRGIPFELGADPSRCLVLADDQPGKGVPFPAGMTVHSVIVTHRHLEAVIAGQPVREMPGAAANVEDPPARRRGRGDIGGDDP